MLLHDLLAYFLSPFIRSDSKSERSGAGFGHCMVLVSRSPADADGANDLSILLQRYATGEDHDLAVVRRMDSEELSSGLRVGRQILGGNVEGARSVRLFLGDIDASDPRPVHADMRHDIPALIRHRDIHRLPDFGSFLLRGSNNSTSVR